MEIRFRQSIALICAWGISLSLFAFSNQKFFKRFSTFSKEVCAPGTEARYQKLFKDYQNKGVYLPLKKDKSLDDQAVKWVVSELSQKETWLKEVQSTLSKKKNLRRERKALKAISRSFEKLVKLKSRYFLSTSSSSKRELKKRLDIDYKYFRRDLLSFINHATWFQSYNYPVDHLSKREQYDRLKESPLAQDKERANRLFLERKLEEDGVSLSHSSYYGDALLRTLVNSIALKINKRESLDEPLRYDLESFFKKTDKELARGVVHQRKKINKWLSQVQAKKQKYYKVLKGKISLSKKEMDIKEYLFLRKKREDKLKNFVTQKQKETYNFWLKEPQEYQRMYSMLTILFNEVGRIEKYGSFERRDIVRLVENRYHHSRYNRIPASHNRSLSFHKKGRSQWLDVLFKEGEFSFTYFYLPSVTKTFCPDMSRRGKSLRKTNLKIVKSTKAQKNKEDLLRYFSRISMIGRIDMGEIWSGYRPVHSYQGQRVRGPASLIRKVRGKDFLVLDELIDDQQQKFWLVRLNQRPYVLRKRDGALFRYRDPALFQFFRSI